jgi:ribosomal protein L24, bacterial/organelle
MNTLHIKTGDKVKVLAGKDRGKEGTVIEVSVKERKALVEGVMIATKHIKPRQMGEKGGIEKVESPIFVDKLQVVCPKCGKGTRVAHEVVDGKKLRKCKKCAATF